jgi:hypothetical protein
VLVHGLPWRRQQDDASLNRERKLARVRAGTAHAALVFDGDACVGWCQFGSPAELPRIKSLKAYEKGLTDLPDWWIASRPGMGRDRRAAFVAIYGRGCNHMFLVNTPLSWHAS